jgi:plastocyanin
LSRMSLKIIMATGLATVMALSALAGCSGGSTVTVTAGGGGTKTVTVTAGGGTNVVAASGLTVYGDMVTNVGCLSISIGHRGELVVWRIRVIDPKTGKDMTDKEVKSVQAILPDGLKFDLAYGGHPGGGTPTDYFWSAPWEIPLNYPTGSLGYEVDATAIDGRVGKFTPFEVASSKLTIAAFDPAFVAAKSANITATGFSVANIVATVGAKLTLTNKDTVDHTINFSPSPFNDGTATTGVIAASKAFSKVLDKAGTYTIKDATNGAITGTITVNTPVK